MVWDQKGRKVSIYWISDWISLESKFYIRNKFHILKQFIILPNNISQKITKIIALVNCLHCVSLHLCTIHMPGLHLLYNPLTQLLLLLRPLLLFLFRKWSSLFSDYKNKIEQNSIHSGQGSNIYFSCTRSFSLGLPSFHSLLPFFILEWMRCV